MDEVVVGPHAARQRASETGANQRAPRERLLDVAGIEKVIADARSTFAPIIDSLPGEHPLVRLIRRLQDNLDEIRRGSRVVDVRTAISLQRATAAFAAWAQDPLATTILQESAQRGSFDHNTALLKTASMLHTAQLGPQLVPPRSEGRTADLILRISASRFVEVEFKAPRALRYPEGDAMRLVEPSETIRKALRKSRGQFAREGILVIAGEIWFGGIDAYAQAAEKRLDKPLASTASPEARAFYERLLGVIFAGAGYEELDRGFRDRLFLRWVPNPRYEGEIDLTLPSDLDGPFRIGFWPDPTKVSPYDETRSPSFDTRQEKRARFRVLANGEIEVAGRVVCSSRETASGRTAVFRFAEGQRPSSDVDFDVGCEAGFTTVTVRDDGSLVADPHVGWIDLSGVRFKIADARH
jgi:hypothetical protein